MAASENSRPKGAEMSEFQMEDMILISVDDHVVEPPDAFIRHFPERLKNRAPRIDSRTGADIWTFEGRRFPSIGLNAVVGRPRDEYGMEPNAFSQLRAGCYEPLARVDDMNANGVLASLNFPTFPGFAGGNFLSVEDKEMAATAVRAYNDWYVLEWCAAAPGRFIPLIILPLWDMAATLAELKRMSDLGVHAISIPDNPALVGLPSLHSDYWDPMWKAVCDYKMIINCHIGTGARAAHASDESPIDAWMVSMPMSISNSASDWLHGAFWTKYPDLRMALSEGGIGWIPYFLERADFTHDHHKQWTFTQFGGLLPSEVFKKHVITCFIDDQFGLQNLKYMNEDLVMWECDYPHSDTVWPNGPEYLWAAVNGLPRATVDKITHQNAIREYHFPVFDKMRPEACTVAALREQAKHVDVSPRHNLGGLRAESKGVIGEARRPVTSGEIQKMFASA
jgi:predicted TIM-barrel fold metal-dependent hydrolase